MSEEKVKLCKDCKFYCPSDFEYRMHCWVKPGEKSTPIRYKDMCAHKDFLSLVDGSPKYSCEEMRENLTDSKCGKDGRYFEHNYADLYKL